MQLGMAELASYLSNWGGSYVLSTAAYNAGAGNVRKWIATFGDPRDARTDPIDWIEEIPFTETRNYVQRVLENTQVYRNRLTGRDEPLRILSDIYRPNAIQLAPLAYTPPAVGSSMPTPSPKPVMENSPAVPANPGPPSPDNGSTANPGSGPAPQSGKRS